MSRYVQGCDTLLGPMVWWLKPGTMIDSCSRVTWRGETGRSTAGFPSKDKTSWPSWRGGFGNNFRCSGDVKTRGVLPGSKWEASDTIWALCPRDTLSEGSSAQQLTSHWCRELEITLKLITTSKLQYSTSRPCLSRAHKKHIHYYITIWLSNILTTVFKCNCLSL